MHVGFAGLGLMGQPMAANLCRSGVSLTVYNRSPGPRATLAALGAKVADSPDQLFSTCDTVILMLADDSATDEVLGRNSSAFRKRISGRLVINMGTHAPSYSAALDAEIRAAGGAFVEAPVSGSRRPAETGQLVAMLAGSREAVERARPLLTSMCREVFVIGAAPSATSMKLAVNLYLIATVTALAESVNLAQASGLDIGLFRQILDSGALRSDVSTTKLQKMVSRDFAPQAAIKDVLKNSTLVADAAAACRAPVPLLIESLRRFSLVQEQGHGDLDMAAILTSFEPNSGKVHED